MNKRIQHFCFFKHWNSQLWLFQTLEFCVLGFPNIGILEFRLFANNRIQDFDFIKHWNSGFFYFLNIQFQYFDSSKHLEYWIFSFHTLEFSSCFGFSKYWNSGLWLSLNIGILDFGFFQCKHWNWRFLFSEHWNSPFWLSQTLELWILDFGNSGIQDCGFSKH